MRPLLRASPKMIARAAGMYAPLNKPAVLPIAATATKPDADGQPDLLDRKAERNDTNNQT